MSSMVVARDAGITRRQSLLASARRGGGGGERPWNPASPRRRAFHPYYLSSPRERENVLARGEEVCARERALSSCEEERWAVNVGDGRSDTFARGSRSQADAAGECI